MAPPAEFEKRQCSKILTISSTYTSRMCLSVLLLLVFSGMAVSQTIVETLPGLTGSLPFKLETGYISVGETDEVQLFYYFIESERSPALDPLVFWNTGGPGCSGFSALAYEIGPITFDVEAFNGSLPSLIANPYSWTRVANIIFIDAPVGAGFSYATTSSAYVLSDTIAAEQLYTFLRKWLIAHPSFMGNPLYIGGDSYSGIIVPLLLKNILQGLDGKSEPTMQLQGYLLGNPVTDYYIDDNSRIPFVHRVSLISDELYEEAKLYCYGDYVNVDANNTLCVTTLDTIKMCLLQINLNQILEPQCAFGSKKSTEIEWDLRVQEADTIDSLLSLSKLPALRCRGFSYVLSYKYMNDPTVQSALGVREGTVTDWKRCHKSLSNYTENISSTVIYHKNFSETTGLRALIYSGDHDISVPYVGTQAWINSLEVPIFDEWRPWYVDGQVAGYQKKYMNDNYRLTYVTIKGAGHTAPEYKHKEALAMVDRQPYDWYQTKHLQQADRAPNKQHTLFLFLYQFFCFCILIFEGLSTSTPTKLPLSCQISEIIFLYIHVFEYESKAHGLLVLECCLSTGSRGRACEKTNSMGTVQLTMSTLLSKSSKEIMMKQSRRKGVFLLSLRF